MCARGGARNRSWKVSREKFTVPDIPALRQPEMTSTERDLGPKVPTIFVMAGKKLCTIRHRLSTESNLERLRTPIHMFWKSWDNNSIEGELGDLRILMARGWRPSWLALREASGSNAFFWCWLNTVEHSRNFHRERERERESTEKSLGNKSRREGICLFHSVLQ